MIDKVIGIFAGGLVSEIKEHPWMGLTVIALVIMVGWNMKQHANASDVSEVKEQVSQVQIAINDIRAAQIEDKIIAARTRHCEAMKSGDSAQKHYFDEQVREYQAQYIKVTGRVYLPPSCNEI